MNNIKSLIAALTFAGLTACADNSPKTFSGFITDASMNTVTVRALTDESTCTFATTDADKSDANGLLLGAPVTVDYTGKLKDGTAATKIATDPTYAEAVGKWTMPDPIAPEGVMGGRVELGVFVESIRIVARSKQPHAQQHSDHISVCFHRFIVLCILDNPANNPDYSV